MCWTGDCQVRWSDMLPWLLPQPFCPGLGCPHLGRTPTWTHQSWLVVVCFCLLCSDLWLEQKEMQRTLAAKHSVPVTWQVFHYYCITQKQPCFLSECYKFISSLLLDLFFCLGAFAISFCRLKFMLSLRFMGWIACLCYLVLSCIVLSEVIGHRQLLCPFSYSFIINL